MTWFYVYMLGSPLRSNMHMLILLIWVDFRSLCLDHIYKFLWLVHIFSVSMKVGEFSVREWWELYGNLWYHVWFPMSIGRLHFLLPMDTNCYIFISHIFVMTMWSLYWILLIFFDNISNITTWSGHVIMIKLELNNILMTFF